MLERPQKLKFRRAFLFSILFVVGVGYSAAAIRIVEAYYGYGSRFKDVTSLVQSYARGDRLYVLVNNENMRGDPSPGRAKEIRVKYRTRPDGEIRSIVVRENEYLSISAQPGPPDRPPSPPDRPPYHAGRLTIVDARYGTRWVSWNVTSRLQRYIRGDRLQVVVNNSNMGGDPLPGVEKKLYLTYAYEGAERKIVVPEQQYLSIPSPDDVRPARRSLEILNANYGSGRRWREVTGLLQERVWRGRLEIYVNNQNLGGDPSPGREKELVVTYRYQGRRYEITAYEGEYLVLPEDVDY